MADTLGEKVKARRKALNMTQVQLAKEAGISQSTLVDIEKDNTDKPRSIVALARALQIRVEDLAGSGPLGETLLKTRNLIAHNVTPKGGFGYIRVKGEVSAGVWRAQVEEDVFQGWDIPIAEDPRFPVDSLFGLIVRGTSVSKFARDGEVAVCLNVWASPRPVQHEDLVVVRRERGFEYETTIKLARYHEGGLHLFTASDDPRYNNETPIPIEGDDESEVMIVGFALHFVRFATRL